MIYFSVSLAPFFQYQNIWVTVITAKKTNNSPQSPSSLG